MAFIIDAAFDAALNYIKTNGTTLHICSAEPANYAAISAIELGVAAVSLTGPAAGDTSGRKVTIPAVTADDVDATGTASYWALSNGSDTLIASGSLSSNVAVSSGGTYNFAATDIEIIDAANES